MSGNVGPPMQRFPRHDPELMAKSRQQAEEFYKWDRQLTQADRSRLSSYFWQKIGVFPILGLPVVIGFIMAPNILKKRGIINPKKRYRLVQFGLGFLGLGVGFNLSSGVSSMIHLRLLKDNEPAKNAYNVLRKYPPQLGSRYFGMTAKSPDLALQDPSRIDWSSNPLFPIILVMNKQIIDKVKSAEHDRAEKYKAMQENRTQQAIQSRSSSPGSVASTGTSWDNVISQNRQESQNTHNNREEDYEEFGFPSAFYNPATGDKPTTPSNTRSPPPPRFSQPSTPLSVPSYTGSDELREEQRKFDEMLEKERLESLKDDFSDTDKKW